jgi:hypothetical protein
VFSWIYENGFKDGGAHVDSKLDEAYYALSRSNSLGWKYIKNGVEKDFATRPELASMRQISYEVLKSLKDEFPEYFNQFDEQDHFS